jgi:hypothetical protein
VSESLIESLVAFALWLHPTWEQDNEDDAESARAAVAAFLADSNKEDRDD